MEAPDTVLELHRDVLTRKARTVYSGDTYMQPYEGDYTERGTATVSLDLTRVWFVLDQHDRAWLEDSEEPTHHFAIDLALRGYAPTDGGSSRIEIETVGGLPLPSLPPRSVTIPNGPRAGETAVIPANVIPLFGTLTLHDRAEPRDVSVSSKMLGIDFHPQPAPLLSAEQASNPLASTLFGANVIRGIGGSVAFGGSDPRVTWDLDYAEQYWIANSDLGQLLITKDQTLNGGTAEEATLRVINSIAVKLGEAVRDVAATLGNGGLVDFLEEPVEIEPDGIQEVDVVVQRFMSAGTAQQSMTLQFRTLAQQLAASDTLPPSLLPANPAEQIAFGRARFAVLRGVRDSLKTQFCLDDTAFLDDEPCKLKEPIGVRLGDLSLTLDRIEATVDPGTDQKAGAVIVDGQIHGPGEFLGITLFDYVSMFNMAFELGLDDVPRELETNEVWPILRSLMEIQAAQHELDLQTCNGTRPMSEIDAESKELKEQLKHLPRTLGVAPALRHGSPSVDSEVAMTVAGYLASIATIAALFAGIAGGIYLASTLTAVVAVKLALAAMIAWMALRILIDQLGEYITDNKVRDALSGDRSGSLLPKTDFLAVDLWLRDHLLVFFRELPPRLDVSCVQHDDTKADVDDVLQQVGGQWPTDQAPWRMTVNDGVLLVKSGRLALFSQDQPISVATSSANREFLRTNPDTAAPNNLGALPECAPFPQID